MKMIKICRGEFRREIEENSELLGNVKDNVREKVDDRQRKGLNVRSDGQFKPKIAAQSLGSLGDSSVDKVGEDRSRKGSLPKGSPRYQAT